MLDRLWLEDTPVLLWGAEYGASERAVNPSDPRGLPQFIMIKPNVTLILARARNGVIGRNGALPWHLPEDLKRFKALTLGHPVVMGRKTWDSILARNGKPLPGRRNIVISRQPGFVAAGAEAAGSLDGALALCADAPVVFVIGGAQIYAEALPRAQCVELTEIDADFEGDAVMPALDPAVWQEAQRETHGPTTERPFGYAFVTVRRR